MGDVHFLQLVIAAFIEGIEFYSYTCNHTNYSERIHVQYVQKLLARLKFFKMGQTPRSRSQCQK